MATEDVIDALKQAADEAVRLYQPIADTPETRAAYARGVRAMAGLVHACIHVAEDTAAEHQSHPVAYIMLKGYARSLRHILDTSEDLIPPGYE